MLSKEKISLGNTLVVHGAASVKLSEGKASILGCPIVPGKPVLVRPERSLPIYGETDVRLEITQDEESRIERYEGSTIPKNWATVSERVTRDHMKVMVIGESDSGKSSFSCYLANYVLLHGRGVWLFDTDPGQANIGPPTTVSYANVSAPFYDPFTLYIDDAAHVGYTSPSRAVQLCVDGAKHLTTKASSGSEVDFSIIDSDGWIEGVQAEQYKAELIKACNIDTVVSIGVPPNSPLLRELIELNVKVSQVDKPAVISSRKVQARRRLRSMGYRKYLKGARSRALPASWVRMDPLTVSAEASAQDYFRGIYCQMEERSTSLELAGGAASKDTGLLSYSYDATGSFAGIGLVEKIDLKSNHVRVFTPINRTVERIVLGRIILHRNGTEVYCAR